MPKTKVTEGDVVRDVEVDGVDDLDVVDGVNERGFRVDGDTREVKHTLVGETPEQRVERERKEEPKVVRTEVELRAEEAELAHAELEVERVKAVIANRDLPAVDTAAASVAHALSLADSYPANSDPANSDPRVRPENRVRPEHK